MYKFLIAALCILFSISAHAQSQDSLFVIPRGDGWMIQHTVTSGETVFILARRYHVPPAILAGANGLNYQSGLKENSIIYIPLAAYNQVSDKPVQMGDARPVYYRAKGGDDLYRISHNSNVQQRTIQQWNNLPDNSLQAGQTLFVGWVLYDATQTSFPAQTAPTPVAVISPVANTVTSQQQKIANTTTDIIPPASPDTTKPAPVSEFQEIYTNQTVNNTNIVTEKGPAVFFDMPGHSNTIFYAFHNTTPRGTIIKVFNPGNGKTIYVKVIGPLPETKLYANSIIGISGTAKEALGVADSKAWCELSFSGS